MATLNIPRGHEKMPVTLRKNAKSLGCLRNCQVLCKYWRARTKSGFFSKLTGTGDGLVSVTRVHVSYSTGAVIWRDKNKLHGPIKVGLVKEPPFHKNFTHIVPFDDAVYAWSFDSGSEWPKVFVWKEDIFAELNVHQAKKVRDRFGFGQRFDYLDCLDRLEAVMGESPWKRLYAGHPFSVYDFPNRSEEWSEKFKWNRQEYALQLTWQGVTCAAL